VEALEDRLCPSSATLDFSTFLGGNGRDVAYAVAVDSAGNSYVTGSTSSANFPATKGALQTHLQGTQDAFVAKFSPTGKLVYATYLGGKGLDLGDGIAVDQYGDAYVTGKTDAANFPVVNGFQTKLGGKSDAFVAKLNPTGSALLYSTYLGGTDHENLDAAYNAPLGGIAVDSNGNAYVTGVTFSSNFPTRNGLPGASGNTYVTRLDTNAVGAASLVYSTLLNATKGTGIAVDNAGNAYVTGWAGTGFTTTPGAYLTSGGSFVAKLNTNAEGSAALVYATFLSAYGLYPYAIAVDQYGSAYVVGQANNATLPVTANAFQASMGGGAGLSDAFVLVLNPSGSGVSYASYLGGSAYDVAYAVAVDAAGHIDITGHTDSPDFPTLSATQGTSSFTDAFVVELDPTAATGADSLIYSSYLGGSASDTGYGIAADGAGNIIVVGQASSGFPTANAFQASYHGAFVTKISAPA
jgi:hypothetical protein